MTIKLVQDLFHFIYFFNIIRAIDRDILNQPVIELMKFSMHITQQYLKGCKLHNRGIN